ncbi:MAG: helix-turn-helix transcriptional regulator [Lachnospiraceae bacterium]|nr:helix-turn-helix transcriptional regulator [Lachnospiraceae bacterium]
MDQTKVGQFLKQLRKEKGITQEEFAEKIGVSGRSVSRWETGSNMPDISLLVEIADFYDVDVREIIEGVKKSEMMNEEIRDTAEKMADYAGAEKSRLLKFAQIIGIIGVIALSVATILMCVNIKEPSVISFIPVLLAFVALVSMMVMTLYVTGVLRKLIKNQTFTIAVLVIIAFAFLAVLKYFLGLIFVLSMLFFDYSKPMNDVEGLDKYDKQYLTEEFSGDMTSHFFLFPDDLSNTEDADFRYEYKVGLLDTDASFFLTATYSDEAFEAEVERISGITCTVNDGNEDHTQAVIYDEDMYRYPAYIAIDGYCHTYEYALIDEANSRVIYVLTSYPDPEHLKEYSDFLKKDPKAYDLGNTSTLDRFCIYSVKMIDFDGYVEYDD